MGLVCRKFHQNNICTNRNYLRDLIDTTSVYLKMMEKFCQGSIVVQTKVKTKSKSKRKTAKPKPPSKEEVTVRKPGKPIKTFVHLRLWMLGKVGQRMGWKNFGEHCRGSRKWHQSTGRRASRSVRRSVWEANRRATVKTIRENVFFNVNQFSPPAAIAWHESTSFSVTKTSKAPCF